MLANDDDFESLGWLADCFWGELPPEEAACAIDKDLAWKLYKEANALGDDTSAFAMAMKLWAGSVPSEGKNVTAAYELLDDLIAHSQGSAGAWMAKVGIVIYEGAASLWERYVKFIATHLLGKREGAVQEL
jgi:hypothetical protein